MGSKKGSDNQTVALKVSVPKGVVNLLRDLFRFGCVETSPESFIEGEVVQSVNALLDELNVDAEVLDIGKIRERYGIPEPREDP